METNTHNVLLEDSSDLKAEFIANSWLESGLEWHQILLQPMGAFKRRSHHDVDTVGEGEIGNFQGHIIEANRSGIYDYLPEQLFHLPASRSINTLKKKVDEIRLQREKERKSRLFFLPLEQEFFRNRVTISQVEQHANDLDADSALIEELRRFWQVPAGIANSTFVRLLPVLPYMSEYRGDLSKAGQIIATVLNLEVTVESAGLPKYTLDSDTKLAETLLGSDLILGGVLSGYLPVVKVKVQLPDPEALEACIQHKDFDTLLTWLLGWVIPVEYDQEIELVLPAGEDGFCLAGGGEGVVRLGFGVLQIA